MNKIHYQDDFSVTVTLKETGGRSIDPSYITDIEFSTMAFKPSVKHLCTVEDKSVVTIDSTHVAAYLNAHKLPPGRLKAIVHYRLPNEAYKDGYQDIYSCVDTDTMLVEGAGDTTYVEMTLTTGMDTAALATALEGKADKTQLDTKADKSALADYLKVWSGTQSAYDAIADKDDQTLYCITS